MSVVVAGPIGGFSLADARAIEFDFNLTWENKVNRQERRCHVRVIKIKNMPEDKLFPLVHFG